MDRKTLKSKNRLAITEANTVCIKCKNYTPNENKAPICLATPLQPFRHQVTGKVMFPKNMPFEFCEIVNHGGNCPKYKAKE